MNEMSKPRKRPLRLALRSELSMASQDVAQWRPLRTQRLETVALSENVAVCSSWEIAVPKMLAPQAVELRASQ
jgi:hypothetical protein